MKLRYFIPSLMAVVAAVFTGCSDDQDPTYLDEIRVSSSYISLPTAGGSTTIDLSASGAWTVTDIPDWLTVSPEQGSGSGTISFSAGEGIGRTATVHLTCEGKTQNINIIQGIAEVSVATCAEVIAGPDAKTYRVTGTVVSNPDNQYGNWYLEDETGRIYIYGTLDKKNGKGSYPVSGANGWGFGTGDVITIEGPKTTYNGTVELVDVTVLSFKKSLVKIEEGETFNLETAGGDFMVRLSVSGDGPYINITDDAKSWLSITSIVKTDTTVNVGFHATENTGEERRTATVSFTSTSGSSSSTVSTSVGQKGMANPPTGTGTEEDPFNVTAALNAAVAGANDVYIKGIVSRAPTSFTASFGNLGYYISADGKQEEELQVYRGYSFGGENFTAQNDIQVGDVVLIKGNLKLYNGAAEIDAGNQLVVLNGQTTMEGINDKGSYRKPFNISEVISYIDGGGTGNVFVAGKVSQLVSGGFSAQYGNGTFWISDDGQFYDDPSKDFEAYRVYWLGNQKWADGDDQIAVGDNVILFGEVTKYKTTYETNQNKAYVFSLNGKAK